METIILVSIFVGLFILIISMEVIYKLRFLKRHKKHFLTAQQYNIEAIYALTNEYYNSNYKKYFDNNPSLATEVFNTAQKAVELIENKIVDADICDFYFLLSSMYESGFGTTKSPKKAREYYQKALKSTDSSLDK